MGNISFGSKYFIFSKFSSIPKTSKIEQERANLKKEYEDLIAFINSDEFNDFVELEKYINSNEHKKLLDSAKADKQKELDKIAKYESQKKSKQFKKYFKFKDSQKLKDYQSFKSSIDLADFLALEAEVNSNEFQNELRSLEQKKSATKEKDEKQKVEIELNKLSSKLKSFKSKKRSSQIKRYFKFENSQKFKDFMSFQNSGELKDYLALEDYLNSAEHKENLSKAEKQENAENDKVNKYEEFKNSKKYKWYLGLKDSNKFDELKKWKVVFEDDFTSNKLDTEKWMTRYYWGDKLIGDAYALEGDKAFPTDGKNIEISNGTLKVVTRKEKVTGKIWKQPFGFVPQEFDFTTGLINSAKTHRQKYGRIEAKIKVNFAKPVSFNFWLASENNLPHVDVLKLSEKKSRVDMAHHFGDLKKGAESKSSDFSGLDVSQDFFIYTFEWTKDKLTWKINDVVVNEQAQNIPNEEMYLVFSSGMSGKVNESGLPASMEIDWVKCYSEEEI
jgi:beta-glucanase (GH16 family)